MEQPRRPEAKAFVEQWIALGGTNLEYDKKRYGKYGLLLAWIWRDGHLLQEDMIRAGHAEVKWITEKDKHYTRLQAAKEYAMATRTCSCGRVWNIWFENVPFRDKDSLNCVCGEELESWNGGCVYYGELISEPDNETDEEV